MQRFLLLRLYVVGVVALVVLVVWGISMSRTADDVETPQASEPRSENSIISAGTAK
jgi:hypothetical protein